MDKDKLVKSFAKAVAANGGALERLNDVNVMYQTIKGYDKQFVLQRIPLEYQKFQKCLVKYGRDFIEAYI